jgi:small-conductance mechanosensitive channel
VDLPTQVEKIIHYPLVTLSGAQLTLAAIIIAVFIFILFRSIAQVIAYAIREGLKRHGQSEGVAAAISQITRYVIVFLGLAISLNTIGVNVNALIAGSAGLLVGIGLGLQNVTSNFVSGLIVLIERPVKRGDVIKVGDGCGTVVEIGLRATRIRTFDDVMLIIPNMELISARVVNQSEPTFNVRSAVPVTVAADCDVDVVRDTLLEIANGHELVLEEPAPVVRLKALGDSKLDFELLFWIPEPNQESAIASDLRFSIVKVFREKGIATPFLPAEPAPEKAKKEAVAPAAEAPKPGLLGGGDPG